VPAFLARAWRTVLPGLSANAEELGSIASQLMMTAAGPLAWRRICQTPLAASRPGRELRQAYRLHALQAVDHERHIQLLFPAMRAAGVEPILIKGWSAARLYPETGLRPYGDIDLCVPPEQLTAAATVLSEDGLRYGWVELHKGVADLPDRTWSDVWRRSRLVPLGQVPVRVLGPEDQIRLLCLHQVRHSFARPLWLCDVAAALESRPADFDRSYCLSGDPRLTRWVAAVIGLACRLLGAELNNPAFSRKVADVPGWLEQAALWRWGAVNDRERLGFYLRNPGATAQAIYYRGLDPIKASLRLGAWPRHRLTLFLVQLRAQVGRCRHAPRRLRIELTKRIRKRARRFDLHGDFGCWCWSVAERA
jgi:hypothetical protein